MKRLDEDALEPRCGEKDLKRQLEKEQQDLVCQQERMESSMPLAPQTATEQRRQRRSILASIQLILWSRRGLAHT